MNSSKFVTGWGRYSGKETLPVVPPLAFAGIGRIDALDPCPYDFHNDGPLAKW